VTDSPDRWHRWLLNVRFGGDTASRKANLTEFLYPVRDTALDQGDALDSALSPREAAEPTAHLRPLVESGTGKERRALAYLTAIRG
jgi:hypothetical protein